MKVCIDPGHGGSQPGAVGPNGTLEKDITLAVSLKLRDLLKAQGFEIIMTRETDKDVRTRPQENELQARCNVANNAKADYFVSIHCNAAEDKSAHGFRHEMDSLIPGGSSWQLVETDKSIYLTSE